MKAPCLLNSLGAFALEHRPLGVTGRAKRFGIIGQLTRIFAVVGQFMARDACYRAEAFFLSDINFLAQPLRLETLICVASEAVSRSLAVIDNSADRFTVTGLLPHCVIPPEIAAGFMAGDTILRTLWCCRLFFLGNGRARNRANECKCNEASPNSPLNH